MNFIVDSVLLYDIILCQKVGKKERREGGREENPFVGPSSSISVTSTEKLK